MKMRKMSLAEAASVVGGWSCHGNMDKHTLKPCYFETDNFAEFVFHTFLNHFYC